MSDIGPAGRARVLVCITCRAATHPTDALATTPGTNALGTNALGTNALGADTPPAGLALAEATAVAAANASDISVQRIRCLGNCSRGPSAAIGCEHSWTYVFGGLEPTRDGPSLIIGARLLALAADGIMPWRGRPESLKRGLIARLPPADFRGELP
jgi:predicted metal-binding protein